MAGNIEWMDDFSGGVNLTLPKNKIPPNTFPKSINTALLPVLGGGAVLGKRPGFSLKGILGGGAAAYAAGLTIFSHNNAGTVTDHMIGVSSEGTIYSVGNPSTQITIPTTNSEFASAALTGATNGVKFAQANNLLFGVCGGTAFKIFKDSGTLYVRAFGGRLPTTAPTGTLGGASSGVMTGSYEFACTFYNSKTGVETGLSPVYSPIALTDQNIDINVSGIGTPNLDFDKVNIYVRKPSRGVEFIRNASMRVDIGDTSTVLNLSDDDLDAMTLLAPEVNDNNPPPSNLTDICWHLSRMFVTDGVNLYYSYPGQPENWNLLNFEPVNPNDGQKIIALHSVNETNLLILKERSAYLLVGDTSQNWEINLLTQSIGCSAKRSVCEGEGVVGWWSHVGPVVCTKAGEPLVIDAEVVRELYRQTLIDISTYNESCNAVFDTRNKRFLFSFTPYAGSTYANQKITVLPFSLVNKVWESSGWDLDTVHAFCAGRGANGEYNVFFSTTNKLVFELSDKFVTDGAQNQTGANLVHQADSFGANTVVFTAATPPYNTAKSYCKVIDTDRLTIHRSTYTLSGSGTLTATLGTSFSTIPTNGLIVFDAPVMELESKVLDGGNPIARKRYLFSYLRMIANGLTENLLGIFIDNATTPDRTWTVTLAKAANEFGTGTSDTGAAEQFRGRVAKSGEECYLRFIGYYATSYWLVSGFGLGSVVHRER